MSNRLLAARVPTSRPYGLRLSWPGAQSANPPELMTGRFVRLMRRRDEFGWGRANASRRTSNDGCPVLMALEVVELGDTKEKASTCGRAQQAIRDLYGERSPSVSARSVRPPSDDRFWRYRRLYPKTAFSRFPPVHRADLERQQGVEGGQLPSGQRSSQKGRSDVLATHFRSVRSCEAGVWREEVVRLSSAFDSA
jgi:hypothetical protein